MSRRYVMTDRATARDETRRRIVAAAAGLHEEIGPRATTISAIAERAGVQRLTVYRHFPDEGALFSACTAHWLSENPLPEPHSWNDRSGIERCRRALSTLYAYYRRTERMWDLSHRDEGEVPALRPPMQAFRDYLAAIVDDLLASLSPSKPARDAVCATLAHAVRFSTWQSITADGRGDGDASDLVCAWLAGLLGRGSPS